jgi:hypothetical protein
MNKETSTCNLNMAGSLYANAHVNLDEAGVSKLALLSNLIYMRRSGFRSIPNEQVSQHVSSASESQSQMPSLEKKILSELSV